MKKKIWSIILIVYVLFVFSNSMKPSDLSSVESGAVLRMVVSVLQSAGLGGLGITEHFIRKAAHFSEYTLYGILLFQTLRTYKLPVDRQWLVHGIAGFLVPFIDETIQLFVEGRSGQISDVWLDCSGVVFGTVLFIFCLWWKKQSGAKRVGKKL
jgi:VanZ family protein